MFNSKKVFNYLIFVFLVLIMFISNVKAVTFYSDSSVCYTTKFEIDDSCSGYKTYVKWTKIDGKKTPAYCGNEFYSFHGGSAESFNYAYKKDPTWSNAKTCKYLVYSKDKKKYVRKNDGDCSRILGYVIKKARSVEGSEQVKFITTQGAVWTYLGAFASGDYKSANPTNWKDNSKIKKAIYSAFKVYSTNKDTISASEFDEVDEPNMISGVPNENPTLYYIPAEDACGKGYYKSDVITIKNNCSKCTSARVIITSYTDAVKLHNVANNTSGGSITFNIAKGGTADFYLSSDTIPTNQKKFAITASYEVETTKKVKSSIPDTVRYLDDTDKKNVQYQSMYILKQKDTTASTTVTTDYSYDKIFNINFIDVEHNACTSTGSYSVNTGENDNVQSNKVCKNNTDDANKPLAKFSACTCKIIYTSNNKPVGIVVRESTKFYYGTFAPSFVYPGGGFAFSDSTNGNPTYYSTTVNWDFADYYDGKPYYYNYEAGKSSAGDASSLTSAIVSDLTNKLKKDITLKVSTEDSNTSKATASKLNPNYEIKFAMDNLSYNSTKKTFTGKVDAIKMNEAVLKSDGVVSYRTSNDSSPLSNNLISGGNKYYVPIKYMNGVSDAEKNFPFNITESNLSLLGFKFKYSANCYETVKNYNLTSDNLRYRPVSETTPFPNKIIPVNWVNWCKEDGCDKNGRIAKSFNKDNLTYSIDLSKSETANLTNKYTKAYTNWDDVETNGIDNFVSSNFNKKASSSSNSFCSLGKFNSGCDQ